LNLVLEIYRQLEKFESFLLFNLSHANGGIGAFPTLFFQQRSSSDTSAGYRANRRIFRKNAGGVPQPGKLYGIGLVGCIQWVASRVLEDVVVTYMGAWFLWG